MAIPSEITLNELEVFAAGVRQIVESGDMDRKRCAVRRFVAAFKADPESHSFRALMHSPSTFCVNFDGSARGSRTPAAALKEPCPNR